MSEPPQYTRMASWLDALPDGPGAESIALEDLSRQGWPLTYAALSKRTSDIARGLDRLGLTRGDRIAIWLANSSDWMAIHFAAVVRGLTTIPINTWCRESELRHYLEVAQPKAIVLENGREGIDGIAIVRAAMAPSEDSLRSIVDLGARDPGKSTDDVKVYRFSDLIAGDEEIEEHPVGENDNAIVYSTSGTTSLPKLAIHRERSLLYHAQSVAQRAQMGKRDVTLCALPPCGAYGYGLILATLLGGGRALLMASFDLDLLIETIASRGITVMALTEPILRRMFDHPRASREIFQSLRIVFSAGTTLSPVVDRAEREFGFRVTNVYGSSEVLALAAFWDFEADSAARSQAGGILVGDDMQVRAVENDRVVPQGTIGELQFRGSTLTTGYLDDHEATGRAFTPDNWYRSGDLGVVADDAGRSFHYVARGNDVLRIRGFLVNPGEIEERLQSHPAVAAAQVVGIANGRGEDVAAAFVTLIDGQSIEVEDLGAFCRAGMASYKLPKVIKILDAFPITKSANGDKVIKDKLRDLAKELLTQ